MGVWIQHMLLSVTQGQAMLFADKRHTSREFREAILAQAKRSAIGLDSPEGNVVSRQISGSVTYCASECWRAPINETPILQLLE
jgi:hypothetical protein